MSETIEAYPLCWPAGRPRTQFPESSRFADHSMDKARRFMCAEVERMNGKNLILSTNLSLRLDGFPRSNQRNPNDRGVAVYFTIDGENMCFACDRWRRIECNLYAIGKTIEALRGIKRWGSGDMVRQAFTGFKALPAPAQGKPWHVVLELTSDCSREELEGKYRQLAAKNHPDIGGDENRMAEINAAIHVARKEVQ